MLIWQGLGFLVPVILMAVTAAAQWLTDSWLGGGYYDGHGVPQLFATALAAALVTAIGLYLRGRGQRLVVDKQTGQDLVLRRRHTLFFIPMEFWGPILLAVGVVLAFQH